MWNDLSFYVAVNIVVVGSQFVLLCSHEEEMVKTVIGEVRMLMDCKVASMGSDLDVGDSDFDSEVGEDSALLYSDADSETDSICEKLVTGCSVVLKHLMLYEAFPTLCLRMSVPVERLSRSLLYPGRVFKSERIPKSTLYPGRVFKGVQVPNWTQCTVPRERASVSSKLPGCIFSAHSKPVEHVSVSSRLPGRIFTAHSKPQMNWTACTVPQEKVPMSVRKPGVKFSSTYKQKVTSPVPKMFQPALSLTRVMRKSQGSLAPVLMFQCRVCKNRVDDSRVQLKRHVETVHGLYTCKNAHCVAAFKSQSARDIHASVHMRKVRKCDHCSEQFAHRFALHCHMTLHAKRCAHKCKICGHSYFRPQDLKEHISTAHESVTFPCQLCQYRGKSKRALKQHELIHKAPSYSCDFCSQTFRWWSQLATHHCE